jgi:signal peptide peptidase SppA
MTAHRLPHLAQRFFNAPQMILPEKAEIIMAALADRFGIAQLFSGGMAVALARPMAFDEDYDQPTAPRRDVGYDVTRDGVAMVPVCGTLVHRLGCVRPYSGMTGYDGVRHNVLSALADPAIRGVLLDIDSPGGEVSGLFDLADTLFAARKIKPVWAVLNESAYSAGYAIASACARVTVPRTGGTGSIGAVVLHTEISKALDKDGITVTVIRSAARKMEGNRFEPLSDATRARIQAEVDAVADLFVDTVARNRNLAAGRIRDMEAGCFYGAAGVKAGLADAVMAPDAAYRALVAAIN